MDKDCVQIQEHFFGKNPCNLDLVPVSAMSKVDLHWISSPRFSSCHPPALASNTS